MVAVHIARDRFQYDPVVIICVPYLKWYRVVIMCSLTACNVSESIPTSIS